MAVRSQGGVTEPEDTSFKNGILDLRAGCDGIIRNSVFFQEIFVSVTGMGTSLRGERL